MDHENLTTLMIAVARYFDLMHEADVSTFDSIFRPTAQLHGLRNGQMRMLSASEYKALLAAGPSPKSKGAPRQEQILLVDFASATQALVKVRVRVDTTVYVDYLSYHFVDGNWLVSAKVFHAENVSK
jgi:hypothetical protein